MSEAIFCGLTIPKWRWVKRGLCISDSIKGMNQWCNRAKMTLGMSFCVAMSVVMAIV